MKVEFGDVIKCKSSPHSRVILDVEGEEGMMLVSILMERQMLGQPGTLRPDVITEIISHMTLEQIIEHFENWLEGYTEIPKVKESLILWSQKAPRIINST